MKLSLTVRKSLYHKVLPETSINSNLLRREWEKKKKKKNRKSHLQFPRKGDSAYVRLLSRVPASSAGGRIKKSGGGGGVRDHKARAHRKPQPGKIDGLIMLLPQTGVEGRSQYMETARPIDDEVEEEEFDVLRFNGAFIVYAGLTLWLFT